VERKLFTLTEANHAIPALSRKLERLRDRFHWLNGNRQEISYLVKEYNIVNEGPVDQSYFETLLGVRKTLKEIEEIGAQIKDVNSGLVDFPSRLFGREVLLCWRLGEDEVGYWHDLEAGFAGRQPLPSGTTGGSGSEGEGQ